ncbi:hypothetical protein AC579_8058 [Pseudocercospora musae]|uniref:Uncharacterized protein n=1 Tax=Pseudocercospora musae TaxID=113226 RepID=A0A139HHQ8_9PEZI|nr:hypothetical protein AC579_8058 [Pseudocercospora musae]
MFHQFCLLILTAAITSLLFFTALWTSQSQAVQNFHFSALIPGSLKSGNGDELFGGRPFLLGAPVAATRPNSTAAPPNVTLVLATMDYTDNKWIHDELGDVLRPHGDLATAIYVVNDNSAPLHTPANKGHEAMAYLSYMIDFYDSLPDISIFMHGHKTAWHNNDLLDMSSSAMVRYLSREKVQRDGYMNLRCHWNPGCPDHLHPFATEYDEDKSEELLIKDAWMQAFEVEESQVPEMLAQPCCSQFAYEHFRDWLLASQLTDYVTGRIFEYFWQYMLNKTPVLCPDPRVCYCEGYGVCFESPGEYDMWLELRADLTMYEQQLSSWNRWQHDKTVERRDSLEVEQVAGLDEEKLEYLASMIDEGGRNRRDDGGGEEKRDRGEELVIKISEIREELERRIQVALTLGADPSRRQAAIEAAKKHDLPLVPRDGTSYPKNRHI